MRIGIDLGGTKIEAIALDTDGATLFRKRIDTPQGSYPKTLAAITALVAAAETDTGLRGSVGVGIPGTLSPATGLVKNANSTWLIGQPLDRDLSERLQRPVRIANDANCFALSEATDGAAAGQSIVFGVILGTGVGGGIVVNGNVLTGCNAVAGEWGHNPLPWPDDTESGVRCYCGRTGCIETWLCGPALSRQFDQRFSQQHSARDIWQLARSGDTQACAITADYYRRLTKSLASVINLLDPDVIVLGGGLSNEPTLYTEVPKLWGEYCFSDRVDTRLLPARFGDASGVRGAAWLWPDSLTQS